MSLAFRLARRRYLFSSSSALTTTGARTAFDRFCSGSDDETDTGEDTTEPSKTLPEAPDPDRVRHSRRDVDVN